MNDIRFVDILKTDRRTKNKVMEWRNKDRVRLCMISQHKISEKEHARWIEQLNSGDGTKFWVVVMKNTPIGAAYLHDIDRKKNSSEWGFYIGEDKYIGKGISKSILLTFFKIVFEDMGIKELLTKVFSDNDKAINLYKKMGFIKYGREGGLSGSREMSLFRFTRRDWDSLKIEIEREAGAKI